jgi:hypothetical protein
MKNIFIVLALSKISNPQILKERYITQNIKEKNNFDVLKTMTKEEWEEVIEDELLEFLKEIVQ